MHKSFRNEALLLLALSLIFFLLGAPRLSFSPFSFRGNIEQLEELNAPVFLTVSTGITLEDKKDYFIGLQDTISGIDYGGYLYCLESLKKNNNFKLYSENILISDIPYLLLSGRFSKNKIISLLLSQSGAIYLMEDQKAEQIRKQKNKILLNSVYCGEFGSDIYTKTQIDKKLSEIPQLLRAPLVLSVSPDISGRNTLFVSAVRPGKFQLQVGKVGQVGKAKASLPVKNKIKWLLTKDLKFYPSKDPKDLK